MKFQCPKCKKTITVELYIGYPDCNACAEEMQPVEEALVVRKKSLLMRSKDSDSESEVQSSKEKQPNSSSLSMQLVSVKKGTPCPNCKGTIPLGLGGCPDCGHDLPQSGSDDTEAGLTTIPLEFVVAMLDRWINTYEFWKGYELRLSQITKQIVEKKPFAAEVVVDILLRTLSYPIPFSNKQKEIDLFYKALRKVTLLAKTQEGKLIALNDFDLLFRRVLLDRLNVLKHLLLLHEKGDGMLIPSKVQHTGLLEQWQCEQREVWERTVKEAIYQQYIKKHAKPYGSAMKFLKECNVLAKKCGELPSNIVELSECNIALIIGDLNGELKVEKTCGKIKFYELLYSGAIYRETGYKTMSIDRSVVIETYKRLSKEEECRSIALTCPEWMLYEHIMKAPLYFKHGTETEAIQSSHSLMSPTVGNQNAKFTSKGMDAKFGHIEYVFGRLEFTYNAMTGGSRYGDIVLCMSLDEIGPEFCISLHDQGIPFDNESTHKSSLFGETVRVIDFKDKHCSEWKQDYTGKYSAYNCFLFEVFYGSWGCRAGLALSLIRELRRYRGKVDLLGKLITKLASVPAFIDDPEQESVATVLAGVLKSFFRTEIRVPCILSLKEPTVVTIFDQTVDKDPEERKKQSVWAEVRPLHYLDYGVEMSVKRQIFCILRIVQLVLLDAGYNWNAIAQNIGQLQVLCSAAAKGEKTLLKQVTDYFGKYKGKLDKLDKGKKVKSKKKVFEMNHDSLCTMVHRMLLSIAETVTTGQSDLITPSNLRLLNEK